MFNKIACRLTHEYLRFCLHCEFFSIVYYSHNTSHARSSHVCLSTLCINLVGRPNREEYARKTLFNVSWGYGCSPDLGNYIALVNACFQTTVDF